MSEIRALQSSDIEAVAAVFKQVFHNTPIRSHSALGAYLRWLYLDMPGADPDISPLVHVDANGEITGFIGVNALPMRFGGTSLRAAICGSLMVKDHTRDPMAGARLLKAFLAGPQDISFSETTSEVSARMWTGLRGIALPEYSLDWVRIIRPGSFAVAAASARLRAARWLAPVGRGIDHVVRHRMAPNALRWSGVPEGMAVKGGLTVSKIQRPAFAALIEPLTRQFSLRPDWAPGQLDAILEEAEKKPVYGAPVFAEVTARGGKAVGAFAYHLEPGNIARVLQVLALPGQAGNVIDSLIADAAARGAAGLRGRIQPALLEAMLGRRIAFTHLASTVVHARDDALIQACRNGHVFFNGIAGEHWSRLIGGRFDSA